MISCNIRQTGSLVRGNLALTSSDCQTRCGDTLLQMLCPPEFEQEPLLKDTPEIMTHYNVSVAITDPGSLFHYTAGAIKHVDYSSKEVCTLCNRYLGVHCVLHHLSTCIPEGHSLLYSSLNTSLFG